MNLDIDLLEKIDNYTNGKMSASEKEAFELVIASDESLQKQIKLSKMADKLLIISESLALKEQMRKDLSTPPSNNSKYWYLLVVLGVSGLTAWYFAQNKTVTNSKVEISQKVNTKEIVSNIEGNDITVAESSKEITSKAKKQAFIPIEEKSETTTSSPIISNAVSQEILIDDKVNISAENIVTKSTPETSKIVNSNPCLTLIGNATFKVTPSCKGESTGEVFIYKNSVKGGKAPYSFALDKDKNSDHFQNLSAGEYQLIITDANNCSVVNEQKVIVTEKKCKSKLEFTFNPNYDKAWIIPYNKNEKPSKLTILEKTGKLYYETSVSNNNPVDWNGESNTGLHLTVGVYFFTIEYENGEIDEGTIVVGL